jgi:hypothetical protein
LAKICSVDGCNEKHNAKGLCRFHYHKKYKEENKQDLFEKSKKYVEKHKERYRIQRKAHREKNIVHLKKYAKKYREDNKEKLNADNRQYHHDNREELLPKMKIRMKKLNVQLKLDAISKYSDGKNKCKVCHEKEIEFLTLDHIDGRKNAEHPKNMSGYKLYDWLKKQDYPPICQVLCMNCNWLKHLEENKMKWRNTYSAICNRKSKDKIKLEVFSAISKQKKPSCYCCDYSNFEALSLDHIKGRDNTVHPEHNKWGTKLSGMEFWRWLKKMDIRQFVKYFA